jgi:hypothetical protein
MVERGYKYIILLFIYSLYQWYREMVERRGYGQERQMSKVANKVCSLVQWSGEWEYCKIKKLAPLLTMGERVMVQWSREGGRNGGRSTASPASSRCDLLIPLAFFPENRALESDIALSSMAA